MSAGLLLVSSFPHSLLWQCPRNVAYYCGRLMAASPHYGLRVIPPSKLGQGQSISAAVQTGVLAGWGIMLRACGIFLAWVLTSIQNEFLFCSHEWIKLLNFDRHWIVASELAISMKGQSPLINAGEERKSQTTNLSWVRQRTKKLCFQVDVVWDKIRCTGPTPLHWSLSCHSNSQNRGKSCGDLTNSK